MHYAVFWDRLFSCSAMFRGRPRCSLYQLYNSYCQQSLLLQTFSSCGNVSRIGADLSRESNRDQSLFPGESASTYDEGTIRTGTLSNNYSRRDRPGTFPGHCLQKAQNSCVGGRQGMASGYWQWLRRMAPVSHSVLFCSHAEFRFSDKVFTSHLRTLWNSRSFCYQKAWFCCHLLSVCGKPHTSPCSEHGKSAALKFFPSAVLKYLGLFFMPMFLCFLPKSSDPLEMHYKKALSIRKGPYRCVF